MDQLKMAVIQMLMTRDIRGDLAKANDALRSIVTGMSPDHQAFVMQHWKSGVDFLKSEKGREAITALADAWMDYSTNPNKSITSDK